MLVDLVVGLWWLLFWKRLLYKLDELRSVLGTHGGRREPTPGSCPLTPTHTLWHMCTHTHTTCTIIIIHYTEKKKLKEGLETKGVYSQGWWSEFYLWSLHSGKRELRTSSCTLASLHVCQGMHVPIPTCTHRKKGGGGGGVRLPFCCSFSVWSLCFYLSSVSIPLPSRELVEHFKCVRYSTLYG